MPGRRPTVAATFARARQRGCVPGDRPAVDAKKDVNKHVEKTVKDQDSALRRYLLWRIYEDRAFSGDAPNDEDPDESDVSAARARWLAPGSAAPTHLEVKAFLRWHAQLCNGLIVEVPTVDSVNCTAEHFFAGFTRITGSQTQDRSEVYHWVRRVLTVEGLVRNVKRPKHNFTKETLDHLLETIWTGEDQMYIHERSRLQFVFLLLLYTATGARISAFFDGGGLQWKDFEIRLLRQPDNQWKPIYKIHQRHVKNNRSPEDVSFQTAMRSHGLLKYDTTTFLLAFAIADGVLCGISSADDLWSQHVSEDVKTIVLPINPDALKLPVLRRCTQKGGVSPDQSMPKEAFLTIFRSTFRNAGYTEGFSIHSIRRGLGKQIDQLYTEAQRSQHLTQTDPRVFGQSYVANMSSCDGQAAFLGEAVDHTHIEYFQSLEPFREPGLPCRIPSAQVLRLKQDPRISELDSKILNLRADPGQREAYNLAKLDRQALWKKMKQDALKAYGNQWVTERRISRLRTPGAHCEIPSKHEQLQHIHRVIPERARLAQQMMTAEPHPPEAILSAMEDIITLCLRDCRVLYLPHLQPRDGRCPVESCRKPMAEYKKLESCAAHILSCCRKARASQLSRPVADVRHCGLCYEWVDDPKLWTDHCQRHLATWTSKRCGPLWHCYTLVCPGVCPFCLGSQDLSAPVRLRGWSRCDDLWQHIREHMLEIKWPLQCPHPLCGTAFPAEEAFFCHLVDVHSLSNSRAGIRDSTMMKRKGLHDDDEVLLPATSATSRSTRRKELAMSQDDRPAARLVDGLLTPPFPSIHTASGGPPSPALHSKITDVVEWTPLMTYGAMGVHSGDSEQTDVDFNFFLRSPSPEEQGEGPDTTEASAVKASSSTSPELLGSNGPAEKCLPKIRIRLKCKSPERTDSETPPRPSRYSLRSQRHPGL